MKIECLIPKRNNGAYFSAAIESLLQQTRPFSRILISENYSTDGSFDSTLALGRVTPDLEVIVPSEPKNSYGENVAYLIEQMSSDADYVFIPGSDDVWKPTCLEFLYRQAVRYPGAGAIFCDRYVVTKDFQKVRVSGSLKIPTFVPRKNYAAFRYHAQGICFNISGAIFRADVVRSALEIIRVTGISSDWILMLEAARLGDGVVYVPRPLFYYRVHPTNTSIAGNDYIDDLSAYASWLARAGDQEAAQVVLQMVEHRIKEFRSGNKTSSRSGQSNGNGADLKQLYSVCGPSTIQRIQGLLVASGLLPIVRMILRK